MKQYRNFETLHLINFICIWVNRLDKVRSCLSFDWNPFLTPFWSNLLWFSFDSRNMSLLYTIYISKWSKQRNFYWWEKNVFLFHLKNIIYLHFCLNEKLSCPGSLQKKTTAGLFLMWNLQVCSGTKFPYKVLALVLFVPIINNKETMMEQQKGVWFIMIRCCWVQINSSTKELTSRQSWQFCCHYCWLKAKPFLRFISAGNPCHRKWHAVSFWFTFKL